MSIGAQSTCRGNFHLFEYAKEHRPLVYFESWVGALFLDDETFIASYRNLVPKLVDIALDAGQSREFLATLAATTTEREATWMPIWRKSTFSETPDGVCVEIAHAHPSVLIRDSKNPAGPTLAITITRWESFLHLVQRV